MDNEKQSVTHNQQNLFTNYVSCINSNKCSCDNLLQEAINEVQKDANVQCFNNNKSINNSTESK